MWCGARTCLRNRFQWSELLEVDDLESALVLLKIEPLVD